MTPAETIRAQALHLQDQKKTLETAKQLQARAAELQKSGNLVMAIELEKQAAQLTAQAGPIKDTFKQELRARREAKLESFCKAVGSMYDDDIKRAKECMDTFTGWNKAKVFSCFSKSADGVKASYFSKDHGVTLTIDGRFFHVKKGERLIKSATEVKYLPGYLDNVNKQGSFY